MTLLEAPPLEGPADPWAEEEQRPRRSVLARLRGIREIGALTLVALVGYLACAFWVRDGLHFAISDALNRTDDALYVTIGRDPHLGAIGFYWPPLPQLIQMPFMPFLRPFGAEIMAGPLSSAICMAATIPVLARVGAHLGLRRWTTFAICVTFAVNPDIVYTASNGMSEACFFLAGAIAMLGFVRYVDDPRTANLVLFSAGLGAVVMTRLEGPLVAAVLTAVATFRPRQLRSSLWQYTLVITPPLLLFLLWMLMQWVLLKDPLFFLHQAVGEGPKPGSAPWLPDVTGHPGAVIPWAFGWVGVVGPLLAAVAAFVVLRPLSSRARKCIGVVAGMGAFLAIQMVSVGFEDGFGDPRYFVMAILFATVGAMVLASRRQAMWAVAWNLILVVVLLISGGTASYALTSGRVTYVENECAFFQGGVAQVLPFLGRSQQGRYACHPYGNPLGPWQDADQWIDGHLRSSDRILADNSSNFGATLFTTRPKLFIVRNDRDWQKTIADPRDVTYIVTESRSPTGPPIVTESYVQDYGAILIGLDRAGWHLVKSYGGAQNVSKQPTYVQIWHFVPSPAAGPTPTGTESSVS